jgi:FkbM family methyltransferase
MHSQLSRNGEQFSVAPGHEWFWPGFENGTWEPSTFKIFDRFLSKDHTFLDIGAWIGPTTLYAASRAHTVLSFEPDTVAYQSLVENVRLNNLQNVVTYPVAVSNDFKAIKFGAKTGFGDSMSSEIWGGPGEKTVPAISFKSLVTQTYPNFIKIDIEGGESTLLRGMRAVFDAWAPTLHLSLHTPWFKNDLPGFVEPIIRELNLYPYFYDEDLNPIELASAFDPNKFNAIVATCVKL